MKQEGRERWSARVTRESRALALEEGVFTWDDPGRIAASLKRSAEESLRRKGTPFQSAMSMLNFYINRAGKGLPKSRLALLGRAKTELRGLFGRGRDGRRKTSPGKPPHDVP